MANLASTSKADTDIIAAISVLDDNKSYLQQQVNIVTQLAQELEANFQTTASNGPSASVTFQGKVTDWLDTANSVIKQFDDLSADLNAGSHTIDAGADNATQTAHSWQSDTSNATFSTLTGAK